ncbi:extracellular solute-binding protein [uncultured Gemmiger sp.]|uniref:extracellular solute-binding protein n=1 Tax=uncultured Gemmiger sp. TaxID=1623490 RepID=UPI0027DC2217|nr:extracellular solute-binding protein [uncultured Gemmiger sp.]
MKNWISRRNVLSAVSAVTAAGILTACGGGAASSAASQSAAAAPSEASSAAESWGDVKLTMWGAEEDQTMLREMADAFIAENADKGNITIDIGVQSESSAKDTVLADPEAAADVFAFADDQLNELVAAGALQEVLLNPDDVKSRNLAGSVNAATMNDKLYAYPMTADNGYFLYYDKSVLSEEDVQSMDTLLAKADASGKKFMMSLNDAWYIYSFYAGAGLKATLADDGINTVCNWNEAPGADVTQAILDISKQPAFKSGADADIVAGIKDGSCCAAISGTWNAGTAEETWGENYAATKLPTYTLNGEQVQMGSFSGYKLVGVNPHSSNVGVAMMLADYITNEDNQAKRFNDRKLGPSNIKVNESEAVQNAPAIAALAAQSEYATLQRVGANYWSSAQSLGEILASGDTQGKTTQQLMDDAVAGITAPVAE